MKWEDFKKRLKNDTPNHQEGEVDVDAIWNAIEPQVDELNQQKKKRRFFFFWMFFAGILVLGSSTYFILSKNNQNNISENNNLITSEVVDNQVDVNVENYNVILGAEKEKIKSNTITSSEILKSNEFSNNKKSNHNNIHTSKSIPSVKIKQQQISTQFPSFKKSLEGKTIQPSKASTLDNSKKKAEMPSVFSNKEELRKPISVGVSFLKSLKSPLPIRNSRLSLLDEMNVFYFSLDDENLNKEEPRRRKMKGKAFQFSLGVYGGASYTKRTFSLKNNNANELLQIRDAYESTLEATHYGFALGMEHRKGWRFSIGIQSSSITEKYQIQKQQVTVDSIPGIVTLRVNLSGDTIPIMGMIAETTVSDFNKKIYNTYRLIDIPVLIGYQRNFGNWKGGVEVGLLANFSFKTEGIVPNELMQDIKTDVVYHPNFKLGYHFGLSLSRSLGDKFDVSISPSVRGYTGDFTKEDYGLSQKYLLIGGNLGLRYKF